MSGPMSPKEILKLKEEITPEFVYKVFNELIAETVNANHTASFFFRTAKSRILVEMNEVDQFKNMNFGEKSRAIDDLGWLNVESAYQAKGWDVMADRTEEGGGFFVFKPAADR